MESVSLNAEESRGSWNKSRQMKLQKGEAQVRDQHFSLCTANALNSSLQVPYFFITAQRSDCLLGVRLLEELCNGPGCTKSGSAETLHNCPSIQWPHLLGVLGGETPNKNVCFHPERRTASKGSPCRSRAPLHSHRVSSDKLLTPLQPAQSLLPWRRERARSDRLN